MKFEFSFDDGHILDLKVAELLEKYGFKGTFYIVCDRVGTKDYLSWEDIKSLDAQGFEIGSHTMSHPQDLKLVYNDELKYELQTSKEMIESVLGHNISKFCYPRGRNDDRVIAEVIEAGYTQARTTIVHSFTNSDPFRKDTTLHIFNRKEYNVARNDWFAEFLSLLPNYQKQRGDYFHIWGHSWEIESNNDWFKFEEMLKLCKEKNDYMIKNNQI